MKWISILLIIVISIFSQIDKSKMHQKDVIQGELIEANNVSAMISNNGWLFWGGGPGGFIVPSPIFTENPNLATMFASGIWLSGKVNGVIRTSVTYYGSDYTPGLWDAYDSDPSGVGNRENDKYKIYYYYSANYISYLNDLLAQSDPVDDAKIYTYAQSELSRSQNANSEWASVAVAEQGAPSKPPGYLAAFAVFHDSDINSRSTSRGASNPLNVQVRVLAWQTKAPNIIDNAVYVKYDIINKNTVPITDAYITLWGDVDIGEFNDDLVGSDKNLNMAYGYNGFASDDDYTAIFGLNPPAFAYKILEAPIIDSPGMTIVQRGSDFPVYINKDGNYVFQQNDVDIQNKFISSSIGMYQYNNGDEPASPEGWYNFMQGLTEIGTENSIKLNAISGGLTSVEDASFFFNGDPESATGWLDSNPNDRRFILNTGPFTLNVSNGTQQFTDPGYRSITFAAYASFGSTHLNSVTKLKFDAATILKFYLDAYFLKPEIPTPVATYDPQATSIQLNWQSASATYNVNGNDTTFFTESYDWDGYKFQGYQVAQPIPNGTPQIVATYDLIDGITSIIDGNETVNGTNSGVQNSYNVSEDYEGNPLYEFFNYDFIIRAYAVNSNNKLKFSAWTYNLYNITTLGDNTIYPANVGQLLNATRLNGTGVANVRAEVVNPAFTTDENYLIEISILAQAAYYQGYPGDSIPIGAYVWSLKRNNNLIISNVPTIEESESNDDPAYFEIIDGIKWSTSHTLNGFENFLVTENANGLLTPPDYAAFAFNESGFPHPTTDDRPDAARQQANGSTWGIHTGGDGATRRTYATYIDRSIIQRGIPWSALSEKDFEIRFTAGPNYGFENFGDGRIDDIPFEVWDVTRNVRLIVAFIDDDANRMFNIRPLDHEISGGLNDPETEWFYWFEPPTNNNIDDGDLGYQNWLSTSGGEGSTGVTPGQEVLGRQVLVNWNGGTATDSLFPTNLNAVMPETGTIFQYITSTPASPGTQFTVTGPGLPYVFDRATLIFQNPLIKNQISIVVNSNISLVGLPIVQMDSASVVMTAINSSTKLFNGHYTFNGNGDFKLETEYRTSVDTIKESKDLNVSIVSSTQSKTISVNNLKLLLSEDSFSSDQYVIVEANTTQNFYFISSSDQLLKSANLSIQIDLEKFSNRENLFIQQSINSEWVTIESDLNDEQTVLSSSIKTFGKYRLAYDFDFGALKQIPKEFQVNQNYPNPFNPVTTISFNLPQNSRVNVTIFNMLGQRVRRLFSGYLDAGFNHKLVWDSKNDNGTTLSSGMYFYQIQTETSRLTKKMMLIK